MKRLFAGLLALICLLSAVSCAENTEETGATEALTSAATEGETVDMSFTDELPELNFRDEVIHVYATGLPGAKDELFSEGLDNTLINDTVYARNQTVEKRLGIKLDVQPETNGDTYTVVNQMHKLAVSGTDDYQFCTAPSYAAMTGAVKGDYLDLSGIEHLDLSKHYWSQGYNEMAEWGDGHQFLASGSGALTMFRYMFITLYSKDVIADRQMEDPFNAVQNGEWTLEYQTTITEDIYEDSNGNGKVDAKDFFGYVSGNGTTSDCHWISCRAVILVKDEDGYITYNDDVERLSDAVDKVLGLYYRGCAHIMTDTSAFGSDLINMFVDNHCFMENTTVLKLEDSLRDYKGEYGILPIAKLNREQAKYATCVQDQVSAFMLPATLPAAKQPMLGAVLECVASESYKTVVDAYYNTALSYRYLNNPESKIMLDLIYDSVSLDVAQIYVEALGGFNYLQTMRSIVAGKKNVVASRFTKAKNQIAKAVDKLNASYEKIVD